MYGTLMFTVGHLDKVHIIDSINDSLAEDVPKWVSFLKQIGTVKVNLKVNGSFYYSFTLKQLKILSTLEEFI